MAEGATEPDCDGWILVGAVAWPGVGVGIDYACILRFIVAPLDSRSGIVDKSVLIHPVTHLAYLRSENVWIKSCGTKIIS